MKCANLNCEYLATMYHAGMDIYLCDNCARIFNYRNFRDINVK